MLTKHLILVLLCAFACTTAARLLLSSKDLVGESSLTRFPQSYGDEDDSQDDGNGLDNSGSTNRAPGLEMGCITGNVGAGGGGGLGGDFDLRGPGGGGSLGIDGGFGGGAGGAIDARLGFGAGPARDLQAGLGGGADASIGLGGDWGRLGGGPPGSSGTGVGGAAP